jgi:hypothetical protein
MSLSVTPQLPPWSSASTSSAAGGVPGSGPAAVAVPGGLTPRTQPAGASASPVRRPLPRAQSASRPAATMPAARSIDGTGPVPLRDMGPENARAALLAMGVAPQLFDAMGYDLRDALNPFLEGPQEARQQRFVEVYGHLVAMPGGLDEATVAALNRMLSPAEAQDAAVLQVVPVLEMEPADARAALLALGVEPAVLARMAHDLHRYTDPFSDGARDDQESRFLADYGQLVALPYGLDNRTVARLAEMLEGLSPQDLPAMQPSQGLPEQVQRIALDGGMSPADALQALRSLDVPEQALFEMAQDLVRIWRAAPADGEQDPARVFARKYGHLIALPARLDADTTLALARMLAPYVEALA